jgi:ATP-binding cassette subfamily F protein 3
VISHDRHLLRNTVDEFYLVADGTLCEFEGDLKDYQVWLKNFVRDINAEPSPALEPAEDKKVARQKAAQNRKRIAPITKKIRQLETLMTQLQSKLAQIENQLVDEDIYKEEKKTELNSCLSGQIEMKKRLSNCEEQWLEYQEELEPENS